MQRVDLTGKIFGDLTVLKYLGNKKYLCKCSCSNTKEVATYSLTSGAVTSCGCKSSRLKYDITNQRFGKLTALRFVGNGKWLCQCDCGKQVEILTNRLITGKTTSCGHSQAYELIGKTYEEWQVIDAGTTRDKVLCKCSCGVTREVDIYNLKNGTTKSCGHSTNEFKDLTGKIFGELQVLKYNDTTKKYICRCSCGNITEVRGHDLRSGNTKSCGHASNNFKDLTGQKFNEWTVLHRTQGYMWMCRCSCGIEKEVASYSLRAGISKSCGHAKLKNKTNNIDKKTREIKDLTGQKFGEWQVIKRDETKPRYWICKCSCGVEKSIQDYSLTSGRSKSCGHPKLDIDISVGKHIWNWDILERLGYGRYRCRCICGKEGIVNVSSLRYGYSKSCGCKQGELQRKTLLSKYGETATNKINNPREKWQIDTISNRENFIKYLKSFGYKPDTTELSNLLGINRPRLLKLIHSFNVEDYISIYDYTSHKETELYKYIESIYKGSIIRHDKNIIKPYELDIYIPDRNIAFEFNGNYWHSTVVKDKDYHLNKSISCGKNKIRLIHIFEYEWDHNQEKIKAFISDLLSNKHVEYARKCKIAMIEQKEADEFIEKYHLSGKYSAKYNYGLFKDNELLSVMTFGKPRFSNSYDFEIVRYAVKTGITIVGGAEKLFKAFIKDNNPTNIVSYCELSKFTGSIYFKMGMEFSGWGNVEPNYVWVNTSTGKVLTRYQTMKGNLIKSGLDKYGDTESEIMNNIGFVKVYDCGNLRFTWNK